MVDFSKQILYMLILLFSLTVSSTGEYGNSFISGLEFSHSYLPLSLFDSLEKYREPTVQ